jgi:gamma-glutamylcyclotransferase (GGCT)/AIG2-like uncharacterized protein YtfP
VSAALRCFDTRALGLRGKLKAARQLRCWLAQINIPPASAMTPAPLPRFVAVYGTLRAGGSNDITRLNPPPRRVGSATLRGTLYNLGSYPGLVLSAEAGPVVAEVYEVSAALEAKLDAIEAEYPAEPDEYAKRELVIEVQDGGGAQQLSCFVYEINPRFVQGREAIASGDWLHAAS